MKIRWEESVPKFGYLKLHLQDGTNRDATTEDLLLACKASGLVVVSAKHVEDMQKLQRECSESASKVDSSRATLCKALDRCSAYEKQAQELRGVLGGDPAGESLIDAARRVVTERETAKAGLRECALAVGLVVQPAALLRENGPMDQVLGAIRNAVLEAKERAAAVKAAEESERLRFSERATIAQVDAVIVNRLKDERDDAIARAEKAEAELEAARASASLVTMVGDIGVRNSGDATRLEAILAERDALAAELAAIRAVAARVRAERPACLVARAVALGVDVRVAEDRCGWLVGMLESADLDEEVLHNVPAADVPSTLSRLLDEVEAARKGGA